MPDPIDKTIDDNERYSEGGVTASIKYIQRDIASINQKLDDKYVTKDEFEPIKRIVYGVITILGISILGAILQLVLKK
jgi:hypothetical protein